MDALGGICVALRQFVSIFCNCGEDRHSPLSYNMALGERILIVPPGTPEKEALSLIRYELDGVGKLED